MKKKDSQEYYNYNTGKVSDIARQLGLAGIALIWIFKAGTGPGGVGKIPEALQLPLFLIVLGLSFDFLQYLAASLFWGLYNTWGRPKKAKPDDEFEAPSQINWPAIFFYWGKVVAIGAAYYFLLGFVYHEIL